jgi:hypothetical protein
VHVLASLLGALASTLIPLVIVGGFVSLFVRRNRDRAMNAPLRAEIGAQVRFKTRLRRVKFLGTGGWSGGTRGYWLTANGPTWLTVGTDAFIISQPQAFREYVFRGRETSMMVTQAPSGWEVRDWIVLTGQIAGRQRHIAITRDDLPAVWQALAGTGVTVAPWPGEFEPPGRFAPPWSRATGWRRVAMVFATVVIFALIPSLVILIAHHL